VVTKRARRRERLGCGETETAYRALTGTVVPVAIPGSTTLTGRLAHAGKIEIVAGAHKPPRVRDQAHS
jgi:hypothetical protein